MQNNHPAARMVKPNSRQFEQMRVIGSPEGFAVYDTGRNKLAVMALDLFLRPGMAPMMQMALGAGNIDVVGKPLFAVVDPANGKPRIVRKIVWADGQETEFPEPEKAQGLGPQAAAPDSEAPKDMAEANNPNT